MGINRASDQLLLFTKRRSDYTNKYGELKQTTPSKKISDSISATDAKELTKKPVSVLLYELSTDYNERKFVCQKCSVTDEK